MTLDTEKHIIKLMVTIVFLSFVMLFVVLFNVSFSLWGGICTGILIFVLAMKIEVLVTLWKDYKHKKHKLENG